MHVSAEVGLLTSQEPHKYQGSSLVYETDFDMILDIVIPMFADLLSSLYAKNEGQLARKDTRIRGLIWSTELGQGNLHD